MLRTAGRPYVCWRCISQRETVSRSTTTNIPNIANIAGLVAVRRSSNQAAKKGKARQGKSKDNGGFSLGLRSATRESIIRERLRGWEPENSLPNLPLSQDTSSPASISNTLTTDSKPIPDTDPSTIDDDFQPRLDRDEIIETRPSPMGVVAGDLLELRYVLTLPSTDWNVQC